MKRKMMILCFPFLLCSCSNGGMSSMVDRDTSSSYKEEVKARHVHDFKTSKKENTCGEDGRTIETCSCGVTRSKKDSTRAKDHHLDENGVCQECGYIDMSTIGMDEAIQKYGFYFKDMDEDSCYSTSDIIFFGSYPQKQVTDASLLEDLKGQIKSLPGEEGSSFISYPYYCLGKKKDYAYYQDISFENKKYRAVYLDSYRPYYSKLEDGREYSYIDDEGYELKTLYFFEFSPIEWKVLDYYDGNLLLSAKYCLDAQAFQDTYEGDRQHFVIPGTEHNTNEWEYSSLRTFLNGTFFKTAFEENEQTMVSDTLLDNAYTSYAQDAKFAIDQNNTLDKVFLLSYQDMLSEDYGFPSKASFDKETSGENINKVEEAKIRRRSYTPYSVIQGLRTSIQGDTLEGEKACFYMLRNASIYRYGITGVNKYGSVVYSGAVELSSKQSQDGVSYNSDYGVLPALNLNVKGIIHE